MSHLTLNKLLTFRISLWLGQPGDFVVELFVYKVAFPNKNKKKQKNETKLELRGATTHQLSITDVITTSRPTTPTVTTVPTNPICTIFTIINREHISHFL